MPAYYNEIDPFAAQWLRNLIAAGHIAPGDVDDRSIEELSADDLEGYDQCHFFAGIGGWSLAFRIAGWPDHEPAWTGSCPCQPLSSAGQRKGPADERHLWPAFHGLIAERRPTTVFGEQVASALGREWFAGVRADLEQLGYACGAADLPAASVGAPHIRQRLWWLAYDISERRSATKPVAGTHSGIPGSTVGTDARTRGGMVNADGRRRLPRNATTEAARHGSSARPAGGDGRMGDANGSGFQLRTTDSRGDCKTQGTGARDNAWLPSTGVQCVDGKSRRVEPGTFPLAHGVSGRVGRLRAYGNAIVPQVAAIFIEAAKDVM